MVAIEVGLGERVNGLGIARRRVRPRRHGRLVGDEEVVHVARYESPGRLLLADDPDYIFAVQVAGVSEEGLFAVVMIFGTVLEAPSEASIGPIGVAHRPQHHVLGVRQRPAGEGAGALLDVVFRVVAYSHREQLQQFSAPVLVYGVLVIVLVVEPDDHSRVAGEFEQQVVEPSHAELPEHSDLVRQRLAVDDLRVSGGEDSVPEQGDLLAQGIAGGDHAV